MKPAVSAAQHSVSAMQFAVAAVHFAWMEACWSFGWKPVALSATMKTRTSRETSASRLAESLFVTWLEACGA